MGKLPAEPAARRAAHMATHAALKDKVSALEGEIKVARENSREAYRQQEMAEERARQLESHVALVRKQLAQVEDENARLSKLLADAQQAVATISTNEVLAVTGLAADGSKSDAQVHNLAQDRVPFGVSRARICV
jgi:chromosome segregation ATPase